MKKLLYFAILISIVSCKKLVLDQLAFPLETTEAYQLEAYDAGDQSVPMAYAIDPSMRSIITMESKDESTGETYTIYGVYIGDKETISTDTIILYCHGQSVHMDVYYPRATLLANVGGKLNYGVLMMDYRGYGMSEGIPDEIGLSEDVDASINWLKDRGAKEENTIYYGFSLGCIPLIERAAFKTDFKPTKIIIESPVASVANLTHSSTIINISPAFITTLEFDNAENMKSVSAPLLWMHGIEDDYIALPNGELIFDNHSGSFKEGIRVKDAGHGNIPKTYGFEEYIKKLESYIVKN
jgi:hypothetical protein